MINSGIKFDDMIGFSAKKEIPFRATVATIDAIAA